MSELIKSESLKELSASLRMFQASQSPIKPNATNPFLKNRYADLSAMIEGTKQNLNEHSLSVTQLLTNDGLTTILLHDSGEYIGSTFKIEPTEGKGTNAAQEMGIAITYSRRYAYGAILGLVTDEDTDGSGKKTPKYEYDPAKQEPPPPTTTKPAAKQSSPQIAEKARMDFVGYAKKVFSDQMPTPMDENLATLLLIADKTPNDMRKLLKWFLFYIEANKKTAMNKRLSEWSKGRGYAGFSLLDIEEASDKDVIFAYGKAKKDFKAWVEGLDGKAEPPSETGEEVQR